VKKTASFTITDVLYSKVLVIRLPSGHIKVVLRVIGLDGEP